MDLHVVGGFLGSGKTTAILAATRQAIANGKRVGIITNDKGHHMVDTALLSSVVPTLEVPGGCFRCNYGDFQERIQQLRDEQAPDVIFAESVGTCVDLAGPVVAPLRALHGEDLRITYSVFADARLLRRRLLDLPMPFSDPICYIFDQQFTEAGLIVINKIDLLSPAEMDQVRTLAEKAFPGTPLLLQDSLIPGGTAKWLRWLSEPRSPGDRAIRVDYQTYGAGAAQLAWFDEVLLLQPPAGEGRRAAIAVVDGLVGALEAAAWPVGHLKLHFTDGHAQAKVSYNAEGATEDWRAALPDFAQRPIRVIVNARVQTQPERLAALIEATLRDVSEATGLERASEATVLSPHVPNPTTRGS